jgi:tRNA-splicing ligase RtcB
MARSSWVDGPVRLMPDAHPGADAVIGSVIVTKGAIIPSAVGTDIGCGVTAYRLNRTDASLPDSLDSVLSSVAANVPIRTANGLPRSMRRTDLPNMDTPHEIGIDRRVYDELGTLGSGNHFLEVDLDEEGNVWLVVHTGSRGPGSELASRSIGESKALGAYAAGGSGDADFAALVEGTPEFATYLRRMHWSEDYARLNRKAVLARALVGLRSELGGVEVEETIDCHHNFCASEQVDGEDRWVTRKGAIRANLGEMGVVCGTMADGSVIVEGLGNEQAVRSAPHGTGRTMSRSDAGQRLSVDALRLRMSGIAWNAERADKLVDESPAAYRTLDEVVKAQSELAVVRHTLVPILNHKG